MRLLEIFAEHLSVNANQIALGQSKVDSLIARRAKDYVTRHLSEKIKLEDISQFLDITTFQFCRKFKQATGLTFVKYLSHVRIDKGKILLHNRNLSVGQIAHDVGFQSLTHFNRIFRKLVGHSPTEYRSIAEVAKGGDSFSKA